MDTKAVVTETIEQAYRSIVEGDLDALMSIYAPDAILQNPAAAPIVGAAALRAFWSNTFSQVIARVEPTLDEVDELGDVVVVRGKVRGTMTPRAGGAELVVDSWFLQIYKKQQDGRVQFWRGANGPNPTRG